MIKKFKLYIILIAMAVSSASCLDKMPEDGIPFDKSLQTVSDINLAVIGIYDAFRSNYLYSGNLTLLPDHTDRPGVRSERQHQYLRRHLALERNQTHQYRHRSRVRCVVRSDQPLQLHARPRGRRTEKDHRRQRPRQAGPMLRRGLLCPRTCLLGTGETLLQGIRKRRGRRRPVGSYPEPTLSGR